MFVIFEMENTSNQERFIACMHAVREISLRQEIEEGKYTLNLVQK